MSSFDPAEGQKSSVTQRKTRVHQSEQGVYDLAIIGGGIHGASLCRQAAAAGLRTILLEARDYGFGISSRSSKMLHGGVRYLEQGDIALVREALSERAYLLAQAPHLTRPQPFLLPTIHSLGRPAWQMRIGLGLYDLLTWLFRSKRVAQHAKRFRPHQKLGPDSKEWQVLRKLGLAPTGLLKYFDGQMDDTRIVIENIIDADELGATTLNLAEVVGFSRNSKSESEWLIQWRDSFCDSGHEVKADYIANLAGPWVPEVHKKFEEWPSDWPTPLYSRGVHLVFNVEWPTSGLILPTREKGRYYFIWPYFSAMGRGTLVGPTSKPVELNEEDPQPQEDEVAELLEYLQRDFPKAGLNASTLGHAFCGMRILAGPPPGQSGVRVNAASRGEKMLELNNYIALLGGKYTTSRHTAELVLNRIIAKLGKGRVSADIAVRPLPGGRNWGFEMQRLLLQQVRQRLQQSEASAEQRRRFASILRASIRRFGSRSQRLLGSLSTKDGSFDVEQLIQAQVRFLMVEEQALDYAGVMSRMGWDDFPDLAQSYKSIILSEIQELSKSQ